MPRIFFNVWIFFQVTCLRMKKVRGGQVDIKKIVIIMPN